MGNNLGTKIYLKLLKHAKIQQYKNFAAASANARSDKSYKTAVK